LVADKEGSEPTVDERGDIHCSVMDSATAIGTFSESLPRSFRTIYEGWDPIEDHAGEVDANAVGAFASDALQAVFSYYDHDQAGLYVKLTVFKSADRYSAAVEDEEEKQECYRPAYSEDDIPF